MAGVAFLFGGGAIKALTETDRLLAEMEGFGLTMLLAGVGLMAWTGADRLEEGESNISLSDSLRK